LLAISGLFIALSLFLKSDFFKIKTIDCQKDGFPCQKEADFFAELKGQNIFTASSEKIINDVKDKIPSLKEIKLNKHFPSRITIDIVSRQPLVGLCAKNKSCYLVDESGFIYKKVFSFPNHLPFITDQLSPGFSYPGFIKESYLLKALKTAAELKKNFILFKQIILNSKEEMTIFLSEPVIASFSSQKSLKAQVDSLQFILRQSKIEGKLPAAIDLRFQKPVIK